MPHQHRTNNDTADVVDRCTFDDAAAVIRRWPTDSSRAIDDAPAVVPPSLADSRAADNSSTVGPPMKLPRVDTLGRGRIFADDAAAVGPPVPDGGNEVELL